VIINQPLGRLERVDLRTVWSSESSDFTPWLAQQENLKLLGETIGLELDLDSTEKNVGPFRADIVCKDTLNNSWVLIENQLERTDHSHLGQLLTYAAGLDAVTIVWVAERFTDEHRAALDWLNEVTDDDINLFGLEVELWKIGSSPVAPKFNIVCKPNDWTKTQVNSRQVQDGGSELDLLKLQFWTEFREYLESHNSSLKSQKPSIDHWKSFAIGRSNFQLIAAVGMRDGYLSISMVMTGPDAKAHFHLLEREREQIDAVLGPNLQWRELPNNKQSDVLLFERPVEPTDPNKWPIYFAWFHQKLEAFYKVFAPRVKKLNAAEYVPPIAPEAGSDGQD
jgi:hypothetical protein